MRKNFPFLDFFYLQRTFFNALRVHGPFTALFWSQAPGQQALGVVELTPVAGEENQDNIACLNARQKFVVHVLHVKDVAIFYEVNVCNVCSQVFQGLLDGPRVTYRVL